MGATILVSSEGGHSEQITSRIPLKPLPAFVCRCCLKNCSGIFLFSRGFLHQKDTLVKKVVVRFDQTDVALLAFVFPGNGTFEDVES